MDIFIHDYDAGHAGRVKEICLRYLFRRNLEADIIIAADPVNMGEKLHETDILGIFFLAVSENLEQITAQIRRKGDQNYIVLMGDSLPDILTGITPATRPAGCILKPADPGEVERLLAALYEDYRESMGQKDVFHFQIRSASYAVPCASILYFESTEKKTRLRTAAQEFEFYMALGKIENELPDYFMRVHKSYIVNLNKIERIDYPSMKIWLNEDNYVYVSRSYKPQLQKKTEGGERYGHIIPDNHTGA